MVTTERIRHATITALFMAVTLTVAAHAAEKTLWKIGTFDGSSGEFRSQDIDYADPKSAVFVAGQSKDKDWYRFQPGPANGIAGGRLHPFTIKFVLNDAPLGVYRLKLAILYETPRLSFLKLEVNGHSGFFYFHPKLDFRAGDWEGTFVPQTSTDEKTISIPAAWLRKGENAFVLTAMDDPATAQNSLGAIAPGHTGLIYDALEFAQDDAEQYKVNTFAAQIEPTIFYRDTKTEMVEVVDVFISAATLPRNDTVELRVAGHSFSRPFSTANQFGEARFVFEVPEWTGAAEATVRIGKLSASATVVPAKKWTVALIPHEHLDVGFTDYPAKVAELHSQSIDQAMGLIREKPDFRWTLDGSWVADQYLNGRSPEAREQFLEHVRAGSIVIPPEFANQHTGNASWEALARSLYGQHNLAREYKLPMPSDAAQIVDVPAYTWGYASVLHDAGIKYFVAASNSWRAPVMLLGRWNEKSPFYWEGPDGSRVLMWYSRAYLQAHTLFGGPWRMESIRDSLPVFLQAYTRPDYTASTAIIFGTQLENTPLAREQSEIVASVSHEYAWPKFEFSTVHSAMQRIEHEWKGEFPVVRGDFGPYWEDGYGSDALHTAIHRENQHRIATAEVMGAAVSSIDTRVRADKATLDDAWRNELLYDEHTWTYVSATTQPEHHQSEDQIRLKGARAVRARDDINESIQRGWAQLEALVRTKDNSIAVFNSLNWVRSGIVETDLPDGTTLVDASSGATIAVEVLRKGKGIALPGFGPGSVRVRFIAASVPAVGYKLYTIKSIEKHRHASVDIRGNVLENEFYRLTLDPSSGAIASVFDKQLGRELVDSSSPYKFGQYLYVTGGDSYPENSLYRFGAGLKPPALTAHPASSGTLISATKTPIGIVATLSSSAPNTPSIQTEILLPNSTKEVLITYHLHKDRVLTRESAYIAFPFDVTAPAFTYGSQATWVNPAKDELAGGSREWYLPTTWASVYNPQVAATVVPLDAPLIAFGEIVRGEWPAEFKPKSSAIFSWLMNNYWGTNFPAWQGGDFTFRYAITSNTQVNPSSLTRFGLEALTPLERDDVPGTQDLSLLPNQEGSLLEVGNPGVTLLTWKRAEDGDGTILRLQDTAGDASTIKIHSPFLKFERAWLCNLLEDNQDEIKIQGEDLDVLIKPFQVLTLRLHTTPLIRQGSAE